MTGAKFMDPRGSAFCLCAYDSPDIQVFAMWSIDESLDDVLYKLDSIGF